MKKIAIQFLSLLFMVSLSVARVSAASVPVPVPASEAVPATEPTTSTVNSNPKGEPDQTTVKAALDEFKNLSKHDRKARIKEAKKAFKDYRATHKKRMDEDAWTILLVVLAILLPPLAVALKEDAITVKFWICLALALLTILLWPLWFLAVLYALLVVFDQL